jgi:poly(hydroxyalkanoate) depolymerase family esterase
MFYARIRLPAHAINRTLIPGKDEKHTRRHICFYVQFKNRNCQYFQLLTFFNKSILLFQVPLFPTMLQQFLTILLLISTTQAVGQRWMERVKSFGENPRNLKMYVHYPSNFKPGMPVVVVLHGCTQTAKQCAELTGWNLLADKNGFVVVYPEQRLKNNPAKCFNWFTKTNQTRDYGEAKSVHSMVRYAITVLKVDSSKIYISGLSAGAAMSTNMLAMYPDIFKAGAIFSGGAYLTAQNLFVSIPAMLGWVLKSPDRLGNSVRKSNPNFSGSYPRIMIVHGTSDWIVNKRNGLEIMKQWTNVHQTDQQPDSVIEKFNYRKRVKLFVYKNKNQQDVVELFLIKHMGHAVATNPGWCPCEGGGGGIFSRDTGFFSTYYAAKFFDLIKIPCEMETSSYKYCN